jgi:PAS domain S-box-containing protein
MLWLGLLGAVTVLIIALRRVLQRQEPLGNELYSKTVAVEHVQSGIAWIAADGKVGSANSAFASIFCLDVKNIVGREWYSLIEERDRNRLEEAYRQMLIVGKQIIEVHGKLIEETAPGLELILVPVHDHKMRFVGHHCLVADRTRERLLEAQVRQLRASLELRGVDSRITSIEVVSSGLEALEKKTRQLEPAIKSTLLAIEPPRQGGLQ